MGVNWAAGLMKWQPFVDPQGGAYPLCHLHPFRFEVAFDGNAKYPALEVDVHVGFAMHTFTRTGVAGDDEAYAYKDHREKRMFDLERYQYSKLLPAIVRELAQRKCYHAKHQNFLTVELPGDAPAGAEYHVFFLVTDCPEETKKTGKPCVRLIIQSAYLVQAGGQVPRGRREQPIGFRVLINRALGLSQPPKKAKPHR